MIRQSGDAIYLTGTGSSPEGDRPFLDRLNLRTFDTDRLFRSANDAYEVVVAILSHETQSVLTRYETRTEPPNYHVRNLATSATRTITNFTDSAQELTGGRKELVTYKRNDGVQLSGTLYLPPGYEDGQRLPMVMWAYPREFVDPRLAGSRANKKLRPLTRVRVGRAQLAVTNRYAWPSLWRVRTQVEQVVFVSNFTKNCIARIGCASMI